MSSDVFDLVNRLQTLSENLAAAIDEDDWARAEGMEAERLRVLKDYPALIQGVSDRATVQAVLDLMLGILQLNDRMIERLNHERTLVARELMHFNSAAQAERAYRSHVDDQQ
ncbi:hypothetical protein FJZ55_03835 [Candidatus Woesearchaeota archaeon]|nr:hypothetical protein [Candidatus Woesearchaeota archaeon]